MSPNVLLLDNKDSFVWNLAQALQGLGARVDVVRSDRIGTDALLRSRADAFVLSPGPGRPEHAGISVAAVLRTDRPLLGVCLGHQAIGHAFGADVVRTPPCHGRATDVHHAGAGLFRGMPSPLPCARYHSLAVDRSTLPQDVVVDAATDDGIVMALRHRTRPIHGFQFHPESFLTPAGVDLLRNFLREFAA